MIIMLESTSTPREVIEVIYILESTTTPREVIEVKLTHAGVLGGKVYIYSKTLRNSYQLIWFAF